MKKILLIISFLAITLTGSAKEYTDSINMAGITDTVFAIARNQIKLNNSFSIEFDYTGLSTSTAIVDVGERNFSTTFNSYGSILGTAFPFTLDVTSNTDTTTNTASKFARSPNGIQGSQFIIKITCPDATTGYLKWKITTH